MPFSLPRFNPPDFNQTQLVNAPLVKFESVTIAGVAPENYHATSVYPEYLQIKKGEWVLLKESRMDCVVVQQSDGRLSVKEFRRLKIGDQVACGRNENGEDGIFVHTKAFDFPNQVVDKFSFRSHLTRETSFSIDYDELYNLLHYEKQNGFIVWVLGPAVVFDRDARNAFAELVEKGYVSALLAGNALATHDVEGALLGTALGQEIYSKKSVAHGHYNHLDALNKIRSLGSIQQAITDNLIKNGIMYTVIRNRIPCVLAGSIRDDGPLPETLSDVYKAQDQMRAITKRATTIIAMATQLHTIATGNMVASYTVLETGKIRPVYFYSVDMSEFAINKLADRGSLTSRSILTNVQDFIVTVSRGLKTKESS